MTETCSKWTINITCPRCFHVGNAEESFPCCDHVAPLKAENAELRAKVDHLAGLIQVSGTELRKHAGEAAQLRKALEAVLRFAHSQPHSPFDSDHPELAHAQRLLNAR